MGPGSAWIHIRWAGECRSVDLDFGWFAVDGHADIDVPARFTHQAFEAQRVNGNSGAMTAATLPQLATHDAHM